MFLQPLMDYYEVRLTVPTCLQWPPALFQAGNGEIALVGSILAGSIQLVAPLVAVLVNLFGSR